jgi:hypothetical protein
MNWDQLKKNVRYRVQVVPIACSLDGHGCKLPSTDDEWIIEEVVPRTRVQIKNTRTGHGIGLAGDHLYSFTSNPEESRENEQRGFLTLRVQVFMRGREAWVRPNARPGESVEPQPVEVVDKSVDIQYPEHSGLVAKLKNEGYDVAWAWDTRLARLVDLEGWEIVIESYGQVLTRFRLEDRPSQTLIKKRIAA